MKSNWEKPSHKQGNMEWKEKEVGAPLHTNRIYLTNSERGFFDLKDEKSDTNDFKSERKFVIRCLEKLQRGDFALEENCGKNKYRLMGAGPKQWALEVRCFILLFQWHKIKPQRTLTWINSALRENIRRNSFTRNIVNSKDTLDTNLKSWRLHGNSYRNGARSI